MDATAWTVVGAAIAILVAITTAVLTCTVHHRGRRDPRKLIGWQSVRPRRRIARHVQRCYADVRRDREPNPVRDRTDALPFSRG